MSLLLNWRYLALEKYMIDAELSHRGVEAHGTIDGKATHVAFYLSPPSAT
jgi:hypothetical protein